MIATAITVALAILIDACFLHIAYLYGAMKGYEKGMDDAEQVLREVADEKVYGLKD